MLAFAYIGKGQHRGFIGLTTVAHITQSKMGYYPVVSTKDGVVPGSVCTTLGRAQNWIETELKKSRVIK